jgi:hypothetical protein
VKQVIRYLMATKEKGLAFNVKTRSNMIQVPHPGGGSDASFNDDQDRGRSTFGYYAKMGDYTISWKSKLTTGVPQSVMEAELIACNKAACEVRWIRHIVQQVFKATNLRPSVIRCDNLPAIQSMNGAKITDHTKHIRPRYFFIRTLITNKEITVVKVATEEQLADMFTKALANPAFRKFRISIGVAPK